MKLRSGVADLGPEIAGALAAGVQFEALGAYDYRSAKRRRHPKSQVVLKNHGVSVSGRRGANIFTPLVLQLKNLFERRVLTGSIMRIMNS